MKSHRYEDYQFVMRIGKKWIKVKIDLISFIATSLTKSKSDVKRLIKDGAVDIYHEE